MEKEEESSFEIEEAEESEEEKSDAGYKYDDFVVPDDIDD